MEEFSVRGLRSSERFALLESLARESSVPFRASVLDPTKPVDFVHWSRRFRTIELSRTGAANILGERTAAQAHDSSNPRLVLTLSAGPVTIEQGGSRVQAVAGSIIPIWSMSPWKITVSSPTSVLGFSLPIDDLGLPHLLLRDLLARDLAASPLASVLSSYLTGLSSLPALDVESESALATPSTDIVRAFLTTAAGDEFAGREPLGRTLGLRVLAYLKAHATDPDLTADRVAAHFGISRRYLFDVMHQREVSMHEWIREERLLRAAALLSEPTNAHVSVAAIGRLCGFSDHSSFSRAFRGRFGCAPSEWQGHKTSDGQHPTLHRESVRSGERAIP